MDLSIAVDGRVSGESVRSLPIEPVNSGTTADKDGKLDTVRDEHQFQTAISAWRKIDLGNLVHELDSTASDIVGNQRDSLVQRKELAQKTKDFRKLDDEAKLQEYKGLLKAYQTFIDLLTNHGKTTSSAFLQLYSAISEAPDPYPLLEASVDSLLVSEDALPKVTAENEHLQRSVSKMTQELEDTEKQLAQERSIRKQLEDSQSSKAKDIEASWQAVMVEKKDNWEAKERSLEEKLENQERLFSEIKASYEVSQRLGRGNQTDSNAHQVSASAAELEIVTSDLERTSTRLAEVEARNEQLRIELAQASSNTQQSSHHEDDPAVLRLRSENGSLMRKLDAARFEKDSESRRWEARIRALERDTQTLQRDREELRDRLHNWRDYPDIKRELEVFKAIEFSTGDDDEDQIDATASASEKLIHRRSSIQANGLPTTNKKDTLEQLLLAKNKKLSTDMVGLRVSHQELQRELEVLRETLSSTNADLERSQNLNATLENDLVALQQEASNAFPVSARSTTSRFPTSAGYASSQFSSRNRRSSPTSSIISGFDPQGNSYDTMDAIRAGEPVGGGSGILPMVQAQRDRFKQKNSKLEEELSKQYNVVSSLRQEVASLQKDNLSLYEKTRYVSTYNRGQQASSASAYSQAPQSTTIQMTADTSSGLSMDRYRSAYEANLSPFAAFRGREASRAYKRMSLPERMVFSVTRLVLASRTSRNLFAVYCLALHVLIFVMLYWMQTVDIQKHASHLGEAVSAVGGGIGNTEGATAHHGEWEQEGLQAGRPA
ncbi:hypothetical protein MMC19_007142 [Ptychographa xylographoides]|nr:hypothetical protein [Ptychographa xylographoides]